MRSRLLTLVRKRPPVARRVLLLPVLIAGGLVAPAAASADTTFAIDAGGALTMIADDTDNTIQVSGSGAMTSVSLDGGTAASSPPECAWDGTGYLCPGVTSVDIDALAGKDSVVVSYLFRPVVVHGGAGNDTITLDKTGDGRLYGEDGTDTLKGAEGADKLYGGAGNDTLNGGYFVTNDLANELYGGDGNDSLDGSDGDDTLDGGADNDSIYGYTGNDTLNGGAGADALFGHQGNDTLNGGDDGDYLTGQEGDDTLSGGDGDDQLSGDADDDTLDGDDGDDRLSGGDGDDTLNSRDGGAETTPVVCGAGLDDAGDGDLGVDTYDADCEETPATAGAPQITLTQTPALSTTIASSQLTFTVSETTAALDCQLDAAADTGDDTMWTPCSASAPFELNTTADGTYTVRVRATDPVGKTGVAAYTWTFDTTAPTLDLTGPSGALIAPAQAAVTVSSDDPQATLTCALDDAPVSPCGPATTVTLPVAGSYRFTATATDQTGNHTERALTLTATVQPPVEPQPPVNPPVDPQPPVNPADPFDTDADGIANNWLVDGKPAPAPARPKTTKVTATTLKISLPKSKKGERAFVYIRAAGGRFVKISATADKSRVLTIKRLKRHTRYEIKLVTVNKAGKQSAASDTLKVKTKK